MPHANGVLENEWIFLRAASSACNISEKLKRIQPLLDSQLRWDVLLGLAERHGVQPLLYELVRGIQQAVPKDHFCSLEQSYQTNVHKALFLSRELIRIVDRLSAEGIEVMPYKGLALAESIYGDIALRQSGDIDLLIHGQDLPRIRQGVRELGYTTHIVLSEAEESAYLKSGYECAFDSPAGRNILELQWAIQPRFYAVDLDVAQLFDRAISGSVAGYPIKTACAEDLFILLSVHAAKHVWGRLIWLSDLARIMDLPNLDWEAIALRARQLGVVRILRITMALATLLLWAELPAVAEQQLPRDPAADELTNEIAGYIAGEKEFDVESAAYFQLMLRIRERSSDRMRFVTRFIFTPGPGEWEKVRVPKSMFPLYRLIRIGRLAGRAIRS